MGNLTENYNKAKTKQEAYEKVKAHITPDLLAKFKVKADIDYNDSAHSMNAKGKGFTFSLDFKDQEVLADWKFSLFLKPIEGAFVKLLKKELEKVI